MFERQRSGSVVCPTCRKLVGVNEPECPHCGRQSPGMFGFSRGLQRMAGGEWFVPMVIGACSVLYVFSFLLAPQAPSGGIFSFLSPNGRVLEAIGASGALPVFAAGRWWTVLSASWLHGSLLHILFNMMWIRQVAPFLLGQFGLGRTLLVYVISGASGFLLTSAVGWYLHFLPWPFTGAGVTVGASASIFGLFGALILYGQRIGSSALSRQVLTWAGILFVLGLVMRGVDNYAHLGGFIGGYLAARALDPLEPETPGQLLGGFLALLISLLAVLLSILTGLRLG